MEIPILNDIATICALSVLIIFIFNKMKIPSIIGFLLVGTVAGPYGLGLISKVHDVEVMAEIGIVLLLFTIGIEFSLKSLFEIKRSVLVGGSFQVFFTIIVGSLFSYLFGIPLNKAIFIGFLISLSSTAIVLKILQDKAQIDSPHGRNILAILIFQDIIAIPMMLLAPFLSGQVSDGFQTFYTLILKIIFIAFFVFILTKFVVPKLFYQIVKTKVSELFLISIIGLCIGIALLTSSMGLSLALGAFIAGLIISESEYSHQALGNILPFKDMFTSLFFVSIGMLLDIRFFTENILFVSLLVVISLIIKSIIGIFSSLILGYGLRSSILVGFAISQIGEFSFVLSKVGITYNLIDNYIYQLFLSVSIFTMAVTPFIIQKSSKISDLVLKLSLPIKIKNGIIENNFDKASELKDHIIIVGFGLNGQNLA
ncbi:MAG: cation:proton antiporter, partial [Candidatus Sericytochromatia bacterium]